MARKSSTPFGARSGSFQNPLARKPSPASRTAPLYPAAGSNGPMEQPPSDTGAQRGLVKVVSQPGDPNFPHDEAEKELAAYIGLKHPKSYRVGIHPAHRRDKSTSAPGEPVFEDGAADVAMRSGLDSAS